MEGGYYNEKDFECMFSCNDVSFYLYNGNGSRSLYNYSS